MDLNSWVLEHSGRSFPFGTADTDYPFSIQVDWDAPEASLDDADHPYGDGTVFGIDTLKGLNLVFDITILNTYRAKPKWAEPLDLMEAFSAMWRADRLRRTPGEVAELRNLERGRMVYGRPRKAAPKLGKVRKGLGGMIAEFRTTSPNFYSIDTHAVTMSLSSGPQGGVVYPIVYPVTTTGGSVRPGEVTNAGSVDTYPVIEFTGPSVNPTVEFLNESGGVDWWVRIADQLAYDQVAVVDLRPWRRSVLINGTPGSGRLRGSAIEQVVLPPGTHQLKYKATDESGTSLATFRWQDAFTSL